MLKSKSKNNNEKGQDMAEAVLQAKRRMPNIPDNVPDVWNRQRNTPDIPDDIPTVKYPEKVIERLNNEYEIFEAQLAAGEITFETAEEFAAKYGIVIEDD